MNSDNGNSNNAYYTDIVKSDLNFINDKMDDLQQKIVQAKDACNDKHAVDSAKDNNVLYSKINRIVDKFCLAQDMLMEKLNTEANFIKYTGEKYDELDKNLKEEAEKL